MSLCSSGFLAARVGSLLFTVYGFVSFNYCEVPRCSGDQCHEHLGSKYLTKHTRKTLALPPSLLPPACWGPSGRCGACAPSAPRLHGQAALRSLCFQPKLPLFVFLSSFPSFIPHSFAPQPPGPELQVRPSPPGVAGSTGPSAPGPARLGADPLPCTFLSFTVRLFEVIGLCFI